MTEKPQWINIQPLKQLSDRLILQKFYKPNHGFHFMDVVRLTNNAEVIGYSMHYLHEGKPIEDGIWAVVREIHDEDNFTVAIDRTQIKNDQQGR